MWQVVTALIAATILMVASFIVFFILQTAIYRMHVFQTMGRNLFLISLIVCLLQMVSGPYLLTSLIAEPHDRWIVSILSGIATFGLTGIYLMIFPVSLERSFSVRLLVNMLNEKEPLSKAAVEMLHTREQIYELRYREMTEGGLVKIENDRLVLLPRGRLVARLYLLLGQSMGYPTGFNN